MDLTCLLRCEQVFRGSVYEYKTSTIACLYVSYLVMMVTALIAAMITMDLELLHNGNCNYMLRLDVVLVGFAVELIFNAVFLFLFVKVECLTYTH